MNEKILMLAQGVYEDEINLKHEIYLRFYLKLTKSLNFYLLKKNP